MPGEILVPRFRVPSFSVLPALGAGLLLVLAGAGPISGAASLAYDSTQNPLPGNVDSQPFQAQQTSEFGDDVQLNGSDSYLKSVTVTMSDWAKKSDWPSVGTATDWTHPITLNVYNVDVTGANPALGSLIATTTQISTIPWRPEADPTCPNPTGWRFDASTCFNGLAFNLEISFPQAIHVPQRVIIGIAYNTQTWGYNPIGVPGPYTSLNVGLNTAASPSVGSDSDPDAVFWNTSTHSYYSDGYPNSSPDAFRRDTGWTGYVPAFQVAVEPGCTTVCYVDAATGDDGHTGATSADAKKTIQAAIDQVSANGEVRVRPGNYDETASGRGSDTDTGLYQFGLFFPPSKAGIDLVGVTAGDVPITDADDVAATITTNATNNFGFSGVFVSADDITIRGLEFGSNAAGDEKTIEVIGDGFTLDASVLDSDGVVYIGDANGRYDDNGTSGDFTDDTSHIQSYAITDNTFDGTSSVYIANGAGVSGPVAGRTLSGNIFNSGEPVSFAGPGAEAWLVYPVGGATVTGNTFTSAAATRYLQAWGNYQLTNQFDWSDIFNLNMYPHAVVTTTDGNLDNIRPYTAGAFTNIYRIGALIQNRVDNAQAGDTVIAGPGDFTESVVIATTGVKLHGAHLGDAVGSRTFDDATESTVNGQITLQAAGAELDGFSVTRSVTTGAATAVLVKTAGSGAEIANNIFKNIVTTGTGGIASAQAIYLENGPDNVSITDNKISDISGERSNKGILIGDSLSADPSTGIVISGNTISNVSSAQKGAYGIQVSNGASTAPAATGYTELSITDNTISDLVGGNSPGWTHAIGLEGDTPIATITGNTISNLSTSGASTDRIAVFFESDPSFGNADVNLNSLTVGADRAAVLVHPALTGSTVDATCNWYGDASGPGGDGPGTGSLVSGALDYDPWLVTSALGNCPSTSSMTPASKDYGIVVSGSTSAATTFTVSNDGNGSDGDIAVSAVGLAGTDPADFDIQTDNCTAAVLSPGETCTIDVAFSPNTTGSKSATLEVDSDDPANPTLSSALTGEGGAAADGSLTIVLQTQPEGNDEFVLNGTNGIGAFSLTDDGTPANTSSFVTPAGAYTVTIDPLAGWTLIGMTCDSAATMDTGAGSVTVDISSGENVTCTFHEWVACSTQPFDDVAIGHPFCVQIKWMKDNGISTGFGDGTYRPATAVSRQAMAAFMARLAGAVLDPCLTQPFDDVPITNPFCSEIQWMKTEGISTGFGDNTYHPFEAVTRQAMAAFLSRLAGATPATCTTEPFSDVPTSNTFCAEITWMKDNGISTGFGDGTYRPLSNVTRQAMAAFMARVSLLLP
jgi:hypothetical protein